MYTIRFSHTSGTPRMPKRPLRRFDFLGVCGRCARTILAHDGAVHARLLASRPIAVENTSSPSFLR